MGSETHDLAVAFAVTTGSGMATLLGAMVVFIPSFYKPHILGVCLALAAGVMLYVSFIEIFFKGLTEFELYFDQERGVNRSAITVDDYTPPSEAYFATTATFFGGIVITWFLDRLIHYLYANYGEEARQRRQQEKQQQQQRGRQQEVYELKQGLIERQYTDESSLAPEGGMHARRLDVLERRMGDARQDLLNMQAQAHHTRALAQPDDSPRRPLRSSTDDGDASDDYGALDDAGSGSRGRDSGVLRGEEQRAGSVLLQSGDGSDGPDSVHGSADGAGGGDDESAAGDGGHGHANTGKTGKELLVMALITGTAIALHNFPEGLATFVATAKDPAVGAPIAIAIAIHNIPEGICVAVPIFFATKNKWRAFLFGTLSGMAEPVAGAVGWGIFAASGSDFDSLIYAFLFSLVSGMMVYISLRELLPTARSYDPRDNYVTLCTFLGMTVMAASLMLFQA
ncbi:hypothetical protein PTSG_12652 [Salpingoeca rosetta]|uniref:Uncharacterized protein n=1 Tax=Salpingoeca rosetta (strain ATCC 50818 / BSB-021) TaxID=946362 RepID=F2UGK9_SALR5|nr:uncharacterized protein PTSG_12652 [Salpingoeca rosetta]EGD75759.1 hypothetical protein PTSG_12652 [Salpingoeca rosetta]|eukprot:XP_004991680.1 hypothetical protein PTSG_12652 [Salpingoeca rosetta]